MFLDSFSLFKTFFIDLRDYFFFNSRGDDTLFYNLGLLGSLAPVAVRIEDDLGVFDFP